MAVESESFTASNGTDITSVGSSIWAYGNGSSGKLFVTSNALRPIVNEVIAWFARRAGTFTDDQYAQGTLTRLVNLGWAGVCVRANTAGTAYILMASSTGYLVVRRVSFGYVQIGGASRSFSVGDIIRLEASGTTLTAKVNGATLVTITDSNIASGNPGVACMGESATDYSAIDDWEGGDLAVTALQSWQYDWPHQLHVRR